MVSGYRPPRSIPSLLWKKRKFHISCTIQEFFRKVCGVESLHVRIAAFTNLNWRRDRTDGSFTLTLMARLFNSYSNPVLLVETGSLQKCTKCECDSNPGLNWVAAFEGIDAANVSKDIRGIDHFFFFFHHDSYRLETKKTNKQE